jgi:hypothetical protein
MYAVLLNLIVTGEIRSVSYRNRWMPMQRTMRMLDMGAPLDWFNVPITEFDSGASIKWRKP